MELIAKISRKVYFEGVGSLKINGFEAEVLKPLYKDDGLLCIEQEVMDLSGDYRVYNWFMDKVEHREEFGINLLEGLFYCYERYLDDKSLLNQLFPLGKFKSLITESNDDLFIYHCEEDRNILKRQIELHKEWSDRICIGYEYHNTFV